MAATRPSSEVDICNLALDLFNEEPIESIDNPETTTEELCARWYHTIRAGLLRKHPWNFALKRAELAEAVVSIPFGFEHAYALPSDFIRLVSLGDEITGDITNSDDELLLRYIYNITNVSQFDSLFVRILSLELGIAIAHKFTASESRVEQLKDDLKHEAPYATSVDGQERPPTRRTNSAWLSRRRQHGTRGFGTPFVTFDTNFTLKVRYQIENGYILTGTP